MLDRISCRKTWLRGAGLSLLFCAGLVHASSITVNAADDIYGAGLGSVPNGAGNLPGGISLNSNNDYLTFSSVIGSLSCFNTEGCVTMNSYGNLNDADGAGSAVGSSSESGYGSISGITAPGAGYLVGVFVDGTPSGPAPSALDFSGGTNFTSLSPALDQVFFIGDGLTGDGSGSTQTFYVPTGATELYLGISDACGYNGGPDCYGDNYGTFTVAYTADATSSTPEPGTSALLISGLGFAGLAGAFRKRRG